METQAIYRTFISLLVLFIFTFSKTQAYDYFDLEPSHLIAFECPKECVCPTNFPRALYCDSKGLKEVPPIPSRIWYLYLHNNAIETLNEKAFVNATQLRWINLNKNKLTNQKIEKNVFRNMKNLLYLFLEDNELDGIPNPLPSTLEQLRLARNKISKIPEGVFKKLENLTLLDLHHNKLTDGSFQADALTELKSLMQFNVAKNSLKKMPTGLPSNTIQLYLDNNNIAAIPNNYFNNIPKIAFLRLNYNKLSDSGVPANVFNVTSMLDLQLSYNELSSLPVVNGHLERLHLDHNKIKNINGTIICPNEVREEYDPHFPHGPRLRYLRLDGNEIQPPIPLDLMICFRLLQTVVI
ncbi:PREDICTED: keratocan [Nanorana parkeri]|uniref:keratocan n=1 Tax=Nanorana parkeri TaxID=125878 RepID=UPI00085453E2|nr:PREDICTED: keratocan [Nanorana parkeri]XP_018412227.1 PREDICTED: keratocan [Nanorana parkeri]